VVSNYWPMLSGTSRATKAAFKDNKILYEPAWLLNTTKKDFAGATDTTNTYYALYHSLKDFYKICQQRDESIEDYFLRFDHRFHLENPSLQHYPSRSFSM